MEKIRAERENWLKWKNIAPLRAMIEELPPIESTFEPSDVVRIDGEIDDRTRSLIRSVALAMKPWRKGPFDVFGVFIDSEWRSFIKYNLLKKHFDLKDKEVADIGCNNGYYLFRMLAESPASLVGFDPSPLFRTQFDFINRFVKASIEFELLGVEHLPFYGKKFDTIFCLGVIYHRSDPVATLKALKKGLKKDGELYLDSFYIEGEEPVALCPGFSYSKIKNVHFVPTIAALKNWSLKAGFEEFEILERMTTSKDEQRKTEWIEGESLENFLDPKDPSKTVEGYPAPRRVYLRLRRGA